MSKTRSSTETSNDEQKTEGSDANFQQEEHIQCTEQLATISGTTIQGLPTELIERILIKAVVMEVRDMKLARRVWKEKADLVMNRFRTVCSQWSNTLATNFFRKEVRRILDGAVHEVIRMEILHQSPLDIFVLKVITTKDEMFMLCKPNGQDYAITVYDIKNMAEVKDVIPLPGIRPRGLAACAVSNCVYLLNRKEFHLISVLCITKDAENKFTISPWKNLWLPNPTISVTVDGSLILSRQRWGNLAVISIYNASGSLQRQLKLSWDISSFSDLIPKPNGHIVLISVNNEYRKKLTEVDMKGSILRQYKSSISEYKGVTQADVYGRILITDRLNRIELLDSEFNLLDCAGPQPYKEKLISPYKLHYNSERNEIVSFIEGSADERSVLTIFHFTEE